MTEFVKGQKVEVRIKPHMPTEDNQWVIGTVEFAGGLMTLVVYYEGPGLWSLGAFLDADIRAINQPIDEQLKAASACKTAFAKHFETGEKND